MLTLLLIGMLTLAFNVQPVKASGTIYIKADGSIDPPTANIASSDNVTYYFSSNIYDFIVIERDNIVVDGAGYTLQGTGSGRGIDLSGRSNVTIKNMEIKAFKYGIYLSGSDYNSISGNTITNNSGGICLRHYDYNNVIFHNNFINKFYQVYISTLGSANAWYDGYPSGGNYWSDYTDVDLYSGPYQNETGSDGIWDHPYVIDGSNQDNYPLVHPWCSPIGHIYSLVRDIKSMGLRERVEDGLVGLLEDAVEFLEEDREVLATITMFRFTLRVQMYRLFGLLTKEQATHLTTEAMKIIHLI